jgi:hypothetical protein
MRLSAREKERWLTVNLLRMNKFLLYLLLVLSYVGLLVSIVLAVFGGGFYWVWFLLYLMLFIVFNIIIIEDDRATDTKKKD